MSSNGVKAWINHPDLGPELSRLLREEPPGVHELRDRNGLLVGWVRIDPQLKRVKRVTKDHRPSSG